MALPRFFITRRQTWELIGSLAAALSCIVAGMGSASTQQRKAKMAQSELLGNENVEIFSGETSAGGKNATVDQIAARAPDAPFVSSFETSSTISLRVLLEKVLVPEMFGAVGDGIADDTEALTKCWNAAMRIKGRIELGAKSYRFSKPLPTIIVPISIVGAGNFRTWLLFDKSAKGNAITTKNVWFGDSEESGSGWDANSITLDHNLEKSGVTLQGFTLVGDRSTTNKQGGIVHYDRHDNLDVRDVSIHNIRGLGWGIGVPFETSNAFLRESTLHQVQVRRCGNQSENIPAFYFGSQGSGTQDVSNHVSFYDLKVVWPDGCAALVENAHPATEMRYIAFYSSMFHGRENTTDNSQTEDLVILKGGITCMQFIATELNGVRDNRWAFVIDRHEVSLRAPRSCSFELAAGPVANGVLFKFGRDIAMRGLSLEALGIDLKVEHTFEGPLICEGTGQGHMWKTIIAPDVSSRVIQRD
jgi:hypothetical protein